MYEYIKDNKLKEILETPYNTVAEELYNKDMLKEKSRDILDKIIYDNGSMIIYLPDRSIIDKVMALESVTYRHFCIRHINDDGGDIYAPIIDINLLFEVNTAYEYLPEKFRYDFDVICAAENSYKEILSYLKKNNNLTITLDGNFFTIDIKHMITFIKEEYSIKFADLFDEYLPQDVKDAFIF